MINNTFVRISKKLNEFINLIIATNPDFIVPVQKKGCKLLNYAKLSDQLFIQKVRYWDYFENTTIDISGKRIAIIDDATKYTSMLYKYRQYFESKGAIVDTFSFVGQKRLETGEREKYDAKAKIFQYLEESTYQEYLTQQSLVLSTDDYFFDIDHFTIRTHISQNRYDKLLYSLDALGNIEFVNDVYTPDNVEKTSIFNIGFLGAESMFDQGVTQGALQKVRLAYNKITHELTIAPLSFPTWNSKDTRGNIFSHVPFLLPYKVSDDITKDGIYFNIVYVFHIFLLKYFLEIFSEFSELKKFDIQTRNLIAFIGIERENIVEKSAKEFILYNSNKLINIENCKRNNPISIPKKGEKKFYTINDIMSELREKYEVLVNHAKSLIDIRYFLAYEEIIERYAGSENLMKWIDILCDRGVLVTRNYSENGIYYRACRSGEGNYDQVEQRSYTLVPIAINACGQVRNNGRGNFSYITTTYLNKVLANFVYDYPTEEYDFHALHSKPCHYGPLTYIKDRINGNTEISIYDISKVTKYCIYDETKKEFVSAVTKSEPLKNEIKERFGQQDSIPFTEITGYFGFLRYIKDLKKTDNFLNSMAICRDEDIYYRHVFFNLNIAFSNIQAAMYNISERKTDILLREAAQNIKSAKTKLKYNQEDIYNYLLGLAPNIVFEQAQQRVIDSFQMFSEEFKNETLPILNKISRLEFMVVNLMLYTSTMDMKYWNKFYAEFLRNTDGIFNENHTDVSESNTYLKDRKNLKLEIINMINNCVENIQKYVIREIAKNFENLPRISDKKYSERKKRENTYYAVNNIKRLIDKNAYKSLVILFYTFSGYRNIDEQKNVDVIEQVQHLVEKHRKIGKLVFGASGSDEFGLFVVDSIDLALEFAENVIKTSDMFSHVFFRFGCAVRKVEISNLDETIKSALIEAQASALQIGSRNAFVIRSDTRELLMDNNKDFVDRCVRTENMKEFYYEYEEIKNMAENIKKYEVNTDENVKIGIVTVLFEEHNAMKSMLTDCQEVVFPGKGYGHQFILGEISAFGGGKHRIALARTSSDGNNKAAIRAARLLEHFPNLEVIFMVGIAGGTPIISGIFEYTASDIKEKHVRLGDIVVSNSIIQYDYVKEKINEVSMKGDNIPPCAKVVEAQQKLEEYEEDGDKAPWNAHIAEALEKLKTSYSKPDVSTDLLFDYNGEIVSHPVDETRNILYPRVFKGKIASSNSVLKNAKKRDMLKREHDVYAIEMETSGVADTSWEAGIGYYAVRGICDYCDSHKNDIWHRYAALVAAAYTKALIEKIPL